MQFMQLSWYDWGKKNEEIGWKQSMDKGNKKLIPDVHNSI
jgi:hypothetical protein